MMSTALAPTSALADPADHRDLGGLLGLDGNLAVAFPLRQVIARATMAGNCCRTTIEQTFANPHSRAMEAVHIFPLPPDGAVTEMEMRCGDVVVRAECRERDEAERHFSRARAEGHRAALLTAERADVHTLRITNVPPGADVSVRFVVVERLDEADGAFTWRFPTVVAPRFTPGTPVGHSGAGVAPDTDRVPDASRLQPPLTLDSGARLDLEVSIDGPLASLESSLHAVRSSFGDQVRVAPTAQAKLDRDFVLRFALAATPSAPARAFTDGEHTLVVVQVPADLRAPRLPRDAVFVIDVSGSMAGTKMSAAQRALKAALRGLESGDRFKLVAFNTDRRLFLSDFATFDALTLRAADDWIHGLRADGGTDMLPALLEAFAGSTPDGRLRTVLFITDGEVTNEAELAAAVVRHRAAAQLFTVGIDTAVNQALLQRLARLGGGTCELMTPDDDIEDGIARLESRLASPAASGVAIEGGDPARPESFVLFHGRPVSRLLRGAPARVVVTGRTADGVVTFEAAPVRTDVGLGALWARERVTWLDDRAIIEPAHQATLRDDILAVALPAAIASPFTAFVAVETSTARPEPLITIVQPAEVPAAWDTCPLSMDAMMAAPPPRRARLGIASAAFHLAGAADADEFDAGLAPSCMMERSSVAAPGGRAPQMPRPAADPNVAERRDLTSRLATTQDADGSFGGDVGRTAAALLALLLLGHATTHGSRRRVVQKAATWLEAHTTRPAARLALDVLRRVEGGGPTPAWDEVQMLTDRGPEGAMLARAFEVARGHRL